MSTQEVWIKALPPPTATVDEVRKWLGNWFTERDVRTPTNVSDIDLLRALLEWNVDGKEIRELGIEVLQLILAINCKIANYTAERLTGDIEMALQYEKEVLLFSTTYRDGFINRIPMSKKPKTIANWIRSWFVDVGIEFPADFGKVFVKELAWGTADLEKQNAKTIFASFYGKGLTFAQLEFLSRDINLAIEYIHRVRKESQERVAALNVQDAGMNA